MQESKPETIIIEEGSILKENLSARDDTIIISGQVIRKPRKTKYNPLMCETLIDIAADGGHVEDMIIELGISRDTFYRWIKDYPDFGAAFNESKEYSKRFFGQILLAGGLGKIKNFNFNAIAMILNNKFPDEYRRSATGSNTEINIGSINTIEQLTSTELDKKIAQLQKKLQLVPQDVNDSESSEAGSS